MKPLLAISCLVPLLAGHAAADEPEAVVRFSNNNRLAGSVVSLSADSLVWKSPVLEKPTPFFLRQVMDISLPSNAPDSAAEHEATVKLTNGDSVCGQLAAVTDQAVTLDTWYAGRLTFNRLMVSDVKIAAKAAFVYRGPNGMTGWKQGEGHGKPAWTYSRGAFRSNGMGSIARDEVLPEECIITFDVAWKGDSIGLKLLAFTTDAAADNVNVTSGYELSFQRGSIYLRNCKTQSFLGNANSQALVDNDHAHIEIKASSKSGKVCLTINDKLLENWIDPDVAKGKFGRGLRFVSQHASPLRISGIGIATWDGSTDRLPEPRPGMMRQFGFAAPPPDDPKPAPPEKKSKEERMELANGDSIQGDVTSVADGVVTIHTPLGEVKLPVVRIRTVALKKVDPERCIRRNGDIRAWFADGNSIVFRLDGVGDGTLTGSSQNFGKATFKTAAFSRIEFNIHDPDLEDKRAPDDW